MQQSSVKVYRNFNVLDSGLVIKGKRSSGESLKKREMGYLQCMWERVSIKYSHRLNSGYRV